MHDIPKFINDQLSVWPLASANFRSLKSSFSRTVTVGGLEAIIQHNPCRITSSTAETDEDTLNARPCFLCLENRPPEQSHLMFDGRKERRYRIQVNPFPIFPDHLVIARDRHIRQSIWHHLPDMLDFAREYKQYTVYYNGPFSGASAPDHLHFQAVPRSQLPLEVAVGAFLDSAATPMDHIQDAEVFHFRGFTRGVYAFRSATEKSLAKMFYRFLDACPVTDENCEPRFNLYCWYQNGYRAMVVLRTKLRSHHYYSEGGGHLTISPGAAEMAGVFVAPVREDYDKVTSAQLEEMLSEVSVSKETEDKIDLRLTRKQRTLEVGIMSAPSIRFEMISDGAGPQTVSFRDGRIDYNGALYDELYFDAVTRSTLYAEASFVLSDVTIGIDFHWQRTQRQKFAGSLKFICGDGVVTAVNIVGLEDYLLSVISSEMNPSAPLEYLKAHAIISRSWVMARMEDRSCGRKPAHSNFDVCADDHCQRYQGIPGSYPHSVIDAIDQTWGETLKFNGELCDTRFSKCCGGRSEVFSTCWEDVDHPYLKSVEDPFCDCKDATLLSRILKDYDMETIDFHDWKAIYTREQVSELIRRRTGTDFGTILSLEPLERGASGRIKRLKVNGTKCSCVIGKELMIRRALSESHLKSSWFDISWEGEILTLNGKGWGHGVGLCQIGAAVMADKGYDCETILKHYYSGADISK